MPLLKPNYEAIFKVASNEQLEKIAQEAEDAFWKVVSDSFPQVKTGDFPPDVSLTFGNQCLRAIGWWLQFNHPDIR